MHNVANIIPDNLYSIYYYSHPSLIQRLDHIQHHYEKKHK